MLEHLVQSHLGGHYITDGEPEFIEAYCETCGDSDEILTSWENSEKDSRVNALLRYFMIGNLNLKEDLDKKADDYSLLDNEDVISSLINDIEHNNDEILDIALYLYENHSINEDEYTKIIHVSNFEEDRQIKMVHHFTDSILSKDSGKIRVLKPTNNKKRN